MTKHLFVHRWRILSYDQQTQWNDPKQNINNLKKKHQIDKLNK